MSQWFSTVFGYCSNLAENAWKGSFRHACGMGGKNQSRYFITIWLYLTLTLFAKQVSHSVSHLFSLFASLEKTGIQKRMAERINGRLLSLMLQNMCIFFFAFSTDKRLIGMEFIALPLLCLLRLLNGYGVSNNNSWMLFYYEYYRAVPEE